MLLLVHPALMKLLLSEIFLPQRTPYPFRISSHKIFLCMLYFYLFCSIQLYYYFLQTTRSPVPPIKILFFHTAFLERTSANPDTRFGVNNNPQPFSSHHYTQEPPSPLMPPPLMTPTPTMTTTMKNGNSGGAPQTAPHQTADVACLQFIQACHVNGNFQDDRLVAATFII